METEVNKNNNTPHPRPCPGECANCTPWQQMYCCTKMTFGLSKKVNDLMDVVQSLGAEVAELRAALPEKTGELSDPVTSK